MIALKLISCVIPSRVAARNLLLCSVALLVKHEILRSLPLAQNDTSSVRILRNTHQGLRFQLYIH